MLNKKQDFNPFMSSLINPKNGRFSQDAFSLIGDHLVNPKPKSVAKLKSVLSLEPSVNEISRNDPNSPVNKYLNEILICYLRYVALHNEIQSQQLAQFYEELKQFQAEQMTREDIRQARLKELLKAFDWHQVAITVGKTVKQGDVVLPLSELMVEKATEIDFWYHLVKGDPKIFPQILHSVNWRYQILEQHQTQIQTIKQLINNPNVPVAQQQVYQGRLDDYDDYRRLSSTQMRYHILSDHIKPENALHFANVSLLNAEIYTHRLDVTHQIRDKAFVLKALSRINHEPLSDPYRTIDTWGHRVLQDKLALVHSNFVEHNPDKRIPNETDIVDLLISLAEKHRDPNDINQKVSKIRTDLSGDEKFQSFIGCFNRWHTISPKINLIVEKKDEEVGDKMSRTVVPNFPSPQRVSKKRDREENEIALIDGQQEFSSFR